MSVETFAAHKMDFLNTYHKGGDGGMGMMMMMMQQEKQENARKEAIAKAENDKAAQIKLDKENWQKGQDKINTTRKTRQAYNSTLSEVDSKLRAGGFDDNSMADLKNQFVKSLDKTKLGMPDSVENINDYINSDALAGIITDNTSTYRNKLNSDLDSFAADGFEKTRIADTMDDTYINKLLDEQQADAKTILDRSLARGTINDVGYATGLKGLSQQRTSGYGKATGLGDAVLNGYRTKLDTAADDYRSKIGKLNFGGAFDVNGARSNIDSLASGFDTSIESDILNAIGGTSFFDTDLLLGKAGTSSGVTNTTGLANGGGGSGVSNTGSVLDPLGTRSVTDEELKKKQGVF